MIQTLVLITLFSLGLFSSNAIANVDGLKTLAEKTDFRETGRYDEVIALCNAFQTSYPTAVTCQDFGTTPEGRPMKVLIVTRTGAFTPDQTRLQGLPVVLVQGGIHAGEIDGKDAGFLALSELLDKPSATDVLSKQVLLFVPVFNVDGHERFGRWNRPNQRGPEAMGWRTTAQNFNLNRDYVKADSSEMQAMLALVNDWDPLAYVDLHVTDGAMFEHDISVQVEPVKSGDNGMRASGVAFRDAVLADLAAKGSLPLPYYPSFIVNDDPTSGFADNVSLPRFSTGYFQLRNRFGMLVETHSWKNYPTRVMATRNTILSVLSQVASHGTHWQSIAHEADLRSMELAGKPVTQTYRHSNTARTVDFRGYKYTRTLSEISGSLMTRYDESTPEVWHLSMYDDIQPKLVINAPNAGYLVPAAHAQTVARKLAQHGIEFKHLSAPLLDVSVQVFRADKVQFSSKSFESHQSLTLEGQWHTEKVNFIPGALFVPIRQAKAKLVMALLEPEAPDSLASWGIFNNAFEQKEYMEAYVAEDVARDMLAKDPILAKTFNDKVASDSKFAKNPEARLEFFARLHSSWDTQLNRYPVVRALTDPQ